MFKKLAFPSKARCRFPLIQINQCLCKAQLSKNSKEANQVTQLTGGCWLGWMTCADAFTPTGAARHHKHSTAVGWWGGVSAAQEPASLLPEASISFQAELEADLLTLPERKSIIKLMLLSPFAISIFNLTPP